jgi:site-specific DNA-methyltransferase (cytosine-N4-specific)
MLRLIDRGYRAKERPSGHHITGKFQKNHGGSIPPNLFELGNNDSNSAYLKHCAQAGSKAPDTRFLTLARYAAVALDTGAGT